MEFFIEFIFEFLIQAALEVIGALIDGTLDLSERTTKAIFKFILYAVLGVVLGYLSYLIMPTTFSGHSPRALISFLLIPLAVGVAGTFAARWTERKWDWELAGSEFIYSFILAWTFAATRYLMLI